MARKTSPAPAPAIDPAALAAALTALGLELPGANGATPKSTPKKSPQGRAASPRVAKERAPATRKRASTKTRVCNITAGEAWQALGADPEFEPGNPDKPASGPMLWRLNDKGMLADLLA